MDFTKWRFPSPSSCEYQLLEVDFSPIMKRPSPESIMGFKVNVLGFHKAQNQKNLSRENQDAFNFPKPAKPTLFMESFQPIQFGSTQSYLWKPGDHIRHPEDTSHDPEEPYIILPYTSKHGNKKIFISGNLLFSNSFLLGGVKDQQLFLFKPEKTMTIDGYFINQKLQFRGYLPKLSRYKEQEVQTGRPIPPSQPPSRSSVRPSVRSVQADPKPNLSQAIHVV
ncbi:hypothetical protein F2Q68_00038666 [Brassica cretica]|uniref:Uncharacterized protein n=2 Tax=Brassica cretica TaxID=69181 RepID=A0ABQ7A575_BRACR|nr:hypothetical protein F2Q68_00038666 [Brassica cretica]KAF3492807.1 hypothetical protein DY000_02052222 [Brassica cretica]